MSKDKRAEHAKPTEAHKMEVPEFVYALSAFFGTKDREYFMENLGMLVGSGSSITESLEAIKKGIRTIGIKRALTRAQTSLENGQTLADALRSHGLVKPHTGELIALAEESGRLSETLYMVAEQEEKDRLFKYKIRSAMMYPVFVLSLTLFIGIGIAWFILPRLATVFDQLDLTLPKVTQWLIAVGELLEAHGTVVVPAILGAFFLILFVLFGYHKTRHIGLRILFAIPGIRGLLQEIELARLGHTLGSLLKAGLPVTTALRSLTQVAVLPAYKSLYQFLQERVEEGNSFAKSFDLFARTHRLVPRPVQQLIISGERSGTLAETFIRVGTHYEEKTNVSAKNLSTILEPLLLVIVWGGVVSVALAVMLPIYNLVGGLNVEVQAGNVPAPVAKEKVIDVSNDVSSDPLAEEYDVLNILTLDPSRIGTVSVLQEPDEEAEVIGEAVFGAQYAYEDAMDGWYEIVYDNEDTGWVSEEYVLLEDSEATEDAYADE